MTDFDVNNLRAALWTLFALIVVALTRYIFFGSSNADTRRLADAMERIAKELERKPGPH